MYTSKIKKKLSYFLFLCEPEALLNYENLWASMCIMLNPTIFIKTLVNHAEDKINEGFFSAR